MQKKLCLIAAALCGAVLCAQTQSPAPAPQVLKSRSYVRRFSAGATLSVLGLRPVPKGSSNIVTSSPPVDSLYSSQDASQRIGYGATVQVAIWRRFTLNSGVFMRRLGYLRDSDIYEGVDNPATTKDDRTHTVRHEDTRTRLFDVPLLVRYYGRDRDEKGPHWFVEGGGVRRQVSHIRTAISSSVNSGDSVCCDVTPAKPAQRSITGLVAGFGVQVIDPVGIRVVPEVRYTRWRGQIFNAFSVSTRADQVEIMLSLTF
jgi:hypothetical protein